MKRRSFLQLIGLGVATAALPAIASPVVSPSQDEWEEGVDECGKPYRIRYFGPKKFFEDGGWTREFMSDKGNWGISFFNP